MIEYFNAIDTKIFLFLNSLHHPALDPIMLFVSDSHIPIALIIFAFLFYGYRKIKKKIFLAFVFILLAVGLSDSISSRIFKPTFERLRPCKQEALKSQVHLAGKKCWGGKYGFISSHAANSFAMALFIFLLFGGFNKTWGMLLPYALLVSYSRIYLGKHFPGDLIVGALLGLLMAYISFKLYRITIRKLTDAGVLKPL